jgi:hypothetical protein
MKVNIIKKEYKIWNVLVPDSYFIENSIRKIQ